MAIDSLLRFLRRDSNKTAQDDYAPHARGRNAEALSRAYLERQGLQFRESNFRCARGEIDLIMQHRDTLVFVEVRARRSGRFGSGADSVDARKQAKLCAAAAVYLQQYPREALRPSRFDVVSVTLGATAESIDWIPDAFQATSD